MSFINFLSLIVLLFMPLVGAVDDKRTDFMTKVQEGYHNYVVLEDYRTENFSVTVTFGRYQKELYYGVFFSGEVSKATRPLLARGKRYYKFPLDGRGDLLAAAFTPKAGDALVIVDQTYRTYAGMWDPHKELYRYEFRPVGDVKVNPAELITGNAKGVKPVKVKPENLFSVAQEPLMFIIVIAASIVIATALIVILFLAIFRKGLFGHRARSRSVPSGPPITPERQLAAGEAEQTPPAPVAPAESLPPARPVKELLAEKGLPTDYGVLSEAEKNTVMVALMIMHKQGEISEEAYRRERIELWRK